MVRWTPENDRLLLLKLIETHGISVNSAIIVAAWPKDQGDVPTARAVTERFVRLRELAGIKVSIGKGGTPRSARTTTFTTPKSSAKKRKFTMNEDETDSADNERDLEVETPTRKNAATRGGPVGNGTRIKQEYINVAPNGGHSDYGYMNGADHNMSSPTVTKQWFDNGTPAPTPRSRVPRSASQRAMTGFAALARADKEHQEESGEKASEEDSAESEFHYGAEEEEYI